ncbi:uncharacterized protein UHOD_08209 [Ustilago sp. UG-2017b]|nr:uncharacterized protein UHOD_08209 [Ustilago sp. UG-2017b]
MSVANLDDLIEAEADIEAQLQAAAEAAETQAAEAEIQAATDLLLAISPPSSPIAFFASPSPLSIPPPLPRPDRSPPKLKLRSSGALHQARARYQRGNNSRKMTLGANMSDREDADVLMDSANEEVDELESPIGLDAEECERLEAECLQEQTQRQSSESRKKDITQPVMSEDATTGRSTQLAQSTLATTLTQRQASKSPQRSTSSQASQRQSSKSPLATSALHLGPSPFASVNSQPPPTGNIHPRERSTCTLFTSHRGQPSPAGSASTIPTSSQAGRKRARGLVKITGSIDLTRESPEPRAPSAKRPKQQDKPKEATPALSERWVQELMATSRGPRPDSPPAEDHVTDPRQSQSGTAQNGSTDKGTSTWSRTQASSSKDDVPLAIQRAKQRGNKASGLKKAIEKAEEAVKDMKRACEEVVGEMAIKLYERDFEIDSLRAKLKARPRKKA